MCLAIAGELIRIEDRRPADRPEEDPALWRMGLVEFSGVRREVSLACVPEAVVGDQAAGARGLRSEHRPTLRR